VDLHAWVFTPHSFRLIIHDLNLLELSPFKEVSFMRTEGHEFLVTLSREGPGVPLTRMQMLQIVKTEIAE
jgi:hypothetical protein